MLDDIDAHTVTSLASELYQTHQIIAMSQNLMRNYGGIIPCQAFFGYYLHDFYDFENHAIVSTKGALANQSLSLETSLRLCMMAIECFQVSLRIASRSKS